MPWSRTTLAGRLQCICELSNHPPCQLFTGHVQLHLVDNLTFRAWHNAFNMKFTSWEWHELKLITAMIIRIVQFIVTIITVSLSEYMNKTRWVSLCLVYRFIANTLSNTMHTIQSNHNMHWRQSCMHYSNIQQCHTISRLSTHKESKTYSWIVNSDQQWESVE